MNESEMEIYCSSDMTEMHVYLFMKELAESHGKTYEEYFNGRKVKVVRED